MYASNHYICYPLMNTIFYMKVNSQTSNSAQLALATVCVSTPVVLHKSVFKQ